ncbi:hypothetical protein [Pseudomonas sp. NPDC089569]|uniref:hypothetical protein n=1 Tax=Pseudomonas sp. NPDC089569 TaxID=3390722 RepID=UPI003CFDFB89
MNRYWQGLILLGLSGLAGPLVQAQDVWLHKPLQVAQNLPNSVNNSPYNSPTRRANPNSMQGTQPGAPAIRGPNTVPVTRPPTLDNGGIGNRYPEPRTTPGNPPTFIPNPPRRDPPTSNY